MLHEHRGPRGAEEEREDDFWTNIPEGADMLPGTLPGNVTYMPGTLDGAGNLNPQVPYTPEAIKAGLDAPAPDVPDDVPAVGDPYVPAHGAGDESGTAEDENARADDTVGVGPSDADPLGSWTGVPEQGAEPTQDADDL